MKFLFTSDWHLTNTIPQCRKDQYFNNMQQVLKSIVNIAKQEDAHLIIAGDILDNARPQHQAQEIEAFLISLLRDVSVSIIAGNHDLLYHHISNINIGSIGVLKAAIPNAFNNIYEFENSVVRCFNFSEKIENLDGYYNKLKIAVLHEYFCLEKPFYLDKCLIPGDLTKYNFDIFVIGDNHKSIIYNNNGKLIFNTGCIVRDTADIIDSDLSVVLFDDVNKTYKTISVNQFDNPIFDIDYIKDIKDKTENIQSFITLLKNNKDISLSFIKNVEKYCLLNNIDESIKKWIYKATQGE